MCVFICSLRWVKKKKQKFFLFLQPKSQCQNIHSNNSTISNEYKSKVHQSHFVRGPYSSFFVKWKKNCKKHFKFIFHMTVTIFTTLVKTLSCCKRHVLMLIALYLITMLIFTLQLWITVCAYNYWRSWNELVCIAFNADGHKVFCLMRHAL
jgi:hypothetical protein